VSELALALYAAGRDVHAAERQQDTRSFAAFADAFDEAAALQALASRPCCA
jgi:hypothetical protein